MVDDNKDEVVDMDEEIKKKLDEPEDEDTSASNEEPESANENDKPVNEA